MNRRRYPLELQLFANMLTSGCWLSVMVLTDIDDVGYRSMCC